MTISVALCTFNGSKYLAKQIDSILSQQNYNVDEIIVCDDGSSDGTLEILSKYQNLNPNIFKVYKNEITLGSTKNFEKSISLCIGDYIFLSDQDDIWKKDKIYKTIHHFKNNPDHEAVFTNADLIDENDTITTSNTLWDYIYFYEKELKKPINLFNVITLNGNIATGATMCITKNTKKKIIPFLNNPKILHDEMISKKMSLQNKLGYISENLISYRLHKSQQVGIKNKKLNNKKTRLKRIMLGLEYPKNVFERRYIFVKSFSKYKTIRNLANEFRLSIEEKEEQLKLIKKSKTECMDTLLKIKKSNIILYWYYLTIDKISKKRQLN